MKWHLALATVLGLFAAPLLAAEPSVVWIEAEQFDNLGGWVNDAQFVDQMGSPYLLAIGLHEPVKDAATTAQIPTDGKYRLWVRCRDWVPEYSPGRFQVVLGDQTVEHVFGQSKQKGWLWEDGGVHELSAGKLPVRLHDLTGYYGRCDAMILNTDLDYRPPSGADALAEARERFGGVSRQIQELGPYDTVVVGGGLAGTTAAVAAAREGCKTALVQNRPVLGGNASTEILVAPQGDTTREPLDPGEGGIVEEYRGSSEGYSERMLALVKAEPNLDLFLNTHATGVVKDGDRIKAVTALNVVSGRRLRIAGKTFIDCTGDGDIGVWAGNEYRHGREPSSMYQESRAPEKPDSRTMGGTLRYASELRLEPVEFKAPEWARKFDGCDDFNVRRHPQIHFGGWQWVIEYGGMLNTYDDAEAIRDELLRIIWGMWDHVKNHCPRLEKQAANYELVWVSYVTGKRESRRLIGDYVMTEHDIRPDRLFEDRVSYGGWGIDLHPPGGFYDERPPATFSHKSKFSVPFRSLYAKDVENLMMAGRCISVSHAALGATRVMVTCAVQGEAVGTASVLCKKYDATPRQVGRSHIEELQQRLLKNGCYLIDLPNQDPDDLARGAEVTASSVRSYAEPPGELTTEPELKSHPLTCDRAVMFRVTADRIDKISLYLHSDKETPTLVELTLSPAKRLGDFSNETAVARSEAQVPPKSEGWIEFPLKVELKPGYYFAWLKKNPGLDWALFDSQPVGTARAYRSGAAFKTMVGCYKHKLDPPVDESVVVQRVPEEKYAPANVVNGYARAIRGWPNAWWPDPEKPLPQWIELELGKPVSFNTVHVTFQTAQRRADAFRIDVSDGDGWRTVAEVTENPHRRRVVAFKRTTADKLRLVITEARPEMGVCEIRVYDEPGDM